MPTLNSPCSLIQPPLGLIDSIPHNGGGFLIINAAVVDQFGSIWRFNSNDLFGTNYHSTFSGSTVASAGCESAMTSLSAALVAMVL
jgi:hypothetical protein